MSKLDFSHPNESELLVAFSDLDLFSKYSRTLTDAEVFALMNDYFEFAGEVIESGGGKAVKFMGDAILAVFPGEGADAGVRALLRLKSDGDAWFAGRGAPCTHRIKAHLGRAVIGPVGTPGDKRPDVYGQAVNTAATLRSDGLAISVQAFRALSPATRKLFRKHTPPAAYVPR